MARSKNNARDALLKLRAERDELDKRERELREAAAADLSKVLIECGAETLMPGELKQLLNAAMALGPSAAIARLAAT